VASAQPTAKAVVYTAPGNFTDRPAQSLTRYLP
jgi:hypothetical protein